ncbi:MAG: hypothetical protein IPN32_15385 [Deltaproteobacteria bacterium]|nr:hypothetical protein [Deltaproteobacteria bacterium]
MHGGGTTHRECLDHQQHVAVRVRELELSQLLARALGIEGEPTRRGGATLGA